MTNDDGFDSHVAPRYPNQTVQTSDTVYRISVLVDDETKARYVQFRRLRGITWTETVRRSIVLMSMLDSCHAARVREAGTDIGRQLAIHPVPYEFDFTAIDAACNIHKDVHRLLQRLMKAHSDLTLSQVMRSAVQLYLELHEYVEGGPWIGELKQLSVLDWEPFELLAVNHK